MSTAFSNIAVLYVVCRDRQYGCMLESPLQMQWYYKPPISGQTLLYRQGQKLAVGKFQHNNGKKGIRKKEPEADVRNQKKTKPRKTAARKMIDAVGLLEVN